MGRRSKPKGGRRNLAPPPPPPPVNAHEAGDHKRPREMLDEARVLQIVPISRTTLQDWVSNGKFPRPVKLSERRIAWYADEVAAWQEQSRRTAT